MYKRTTSILRILESGSGMITANMREVPAAAMMEAGIQVETFAPHCLTRIRDMEISSRKNLIYSDLLYSLCPPAYLFIFI